MSTPPSRVIELLGGAKAVSDQLGRPLTTVASWASRGSIPVEAWQELVDMARKRGVGEITYEAMAAAHSKNARKPVTKEPPVPAQKRAARRAGFPEAGPRRRAAA